MDDLIKRLRSVDVSWSHEGELCAWAADRIETLEKALRYIIDEWADEYEAGGLENFCRAALGEKKDDG